MRLSKYLRFAGLAFALLLIPAWASAQQSITCESNNGKRNYCGNVQNSGQVVMQRRLSQSSCVRNSSWGVDGRGLWVDRGCRAVFGFGYNGGGSGGGWWDPNPNDRWPPSGDSHGGNWGRGGVFFYKDRNFCSGYFCMRRGEYRNLWGATAKISLRSASSEGLMSPSTMTATNRGSHTTTGRDVRTFATGA